MPIVKAPAGDFHTSVAAEGIAVFVFAGDCQRHGQTPSLNACTMDHGAKIAEVRHHRLHDYLAVLETFAVCKQYPQSFARLWLQGNAYRGWHLKRCRRDPDFMHR